MSNLVQVAIRTMLKGLVFSLVLIIFACNSSRQNPGHNFFNDGDYDLAIIELRAEERKNPNDWQIKRDLGISYFRTQQYNNAVGKLFEAAKINPKDKVTLLYLGLAYEMTEEQEKASILYRYCAKLKFKESLRLELLARSRDAEIESFKQKIRHNLKSAQKTAPRNSIAVLYFRNLSKWDELEPILKGLAEFLSQDLAKINDLTIIDRKKVQVLIEILGLSPDDFLDQTKMTEVAKLLGVEMLITGAIERIKDDRIRLTAGIVDGMTGQLLGERIQEEGRLSQILEMEKNIIFHLVESLGVAISSDELQHLKQFYTTSSLSFIAFSKGLHYSDNNAFIEARIQFQKALQEDSSFNPAKVHLEQIPSQRLTVAEIERIVMQI